MSEVKSSKEAKSKLETLRAWFWMCPECGAEAAKVGHGDILTAVITCENGHKARPIAEVVSNLEEPHHDHT